MRTRGFATALAAVICLAVPAVAGAAAPTKSVFETDAGFVVPYCGFPVLMELQGTFALLTFTDDEGNVVRSAQHPAGPVDASVMNVDTEESLDLRASGPARVNALPEGGFEFTTLGHTLAFVHPDTGEPGVFQLTGRQTQTFGSTEDSYEFRGRVVDLCAELAG